jgi:hypothetical protein
MNILNGVSIVVPAPTFTAQPFVVHQLERLLEWQLRAIHYFGQFFARLFVVNRPTTSTQSLLSKKEPTGPDGVPE